jgi:hypothetical protein
VWPWAYSIWQVAGFELAHFAFSFCAAFVVVSPVVYWTLTTYRAYWDGTRPYYSDSEARESLTRVVFYMVLLSLSAGLAAHVLEDIFIGAF